MVRLAKYLKPYLLLLLIAVALLFIQANADLALPDYMSNIVDYGIQQGGVVNAVPMAIRQSEMNRLVMFMTADNKNAVLADYTLVNKSSADYATDVKLYPVLATESIYVLNKNVAQSEITKLNPIMGEALLVVSSIEQALANPAAAQAMSQSFGFDLSKIPPGTDVFVMLQKLPSYDPGPDRSHDRSEICHAGYQHDRADVRRRGQDRIWRLGDGYRGIINQLHHPYRDANAAVNITFRSLHDLCGVPFGPHCGRTGSRSASQYLPKSGKLL